MHHISKDEALKKGEKDGCHVGCTFFLRYTNDYLEKGEEMTPGKPWKKIQIVANGNVMFVLFAINNLEYIYDECRIMFRYISNF